VSSLYLDADYVYCTTVSGLDVYDIASEDLYAYIIYSGGFNAIWGNDDRIFIGTSAAGIKYVDKTCISGSLSEAVDVSSCLDDFSNLTAYSALTSDYIRCLHGYGDIVMAVTDSGVDIIKIDPQSYRSYTVVTDAYKGFMLSNDEFYYTISGSEWSLNKVYTCLVDWSTPDYSWVTGSGVLASSITINDIFITERTGSAGIGNTVYIATSSGVYVIDEDSDRYAVYYVEG